MRSLDHREVLGKAYEKMLPAFGYLHSPIAGFAASLVVFTTWLAKKILGARYAVEHAIEKDEELLIDLRYRIKRMEEKIRQAEEALSLVTSEWDRERLQRDISSYKRDLERLREEYELVSMRLYAVKKLLELGEKGVLKKVDKIIENLEKGKATKAEYEALRLMEEEWRRRQLTLDVVRRILEEG